MSKVKIKVTINSEVQETTALYQDGIYKYKEKDNTTVVLNTKDDSLQRENNDLKMNYLWKEQEETEGMINIKEYNRIVKVNIKTERIKKTSAIIEIIFSVENNPFTYSLEVQEWVF